MHLKLQWETKNLPVRHPVFLSTLWSSEMTSSSHLLSPCQATIKACFWSLWKQKSRSPAPSQWYRRFGRHHPEHHPKTWNFFVSATPLVPTVAQQPSSVDWEWVLDVVFVLDTTGIHNNRVEVMELHGFQKKTATCFHSSESARVKIPR